METPIHSPINEIITYGLTIIKMKRLHNISQRRHRAERTPSIYLRPTPLHFCHRDSITKYFVGF